MFLHNAFSVNFRKMTGHVLNNNKRDLSTLLNLKKPTLISITQNFNKNPTILMRYNFSEQNRKLNSKLYILRNIQIFNNRTQISERSPPQYPSYPSYPYQKYERFRNYNTPFYQKQIFWAYTGAVGGL